MRHSRCFSDASSEQILSLLLGLKLFGAGGLMVDSTADSEEYFRDRTARLIRRFKPLGKSLVSVLAGSFNVLQELNSTEHKVRHEPPFIIGSHAAPSVS
jgi:hypothetical protein